MMRKNEQASLVFQRVKNMQATSLSKNLILKAIRTDAAVTMNLATMKSLFLLRVALAITLTMQRPALETAAVGYEVPRNKLLHNEHQRVKFLVS